MKLSTLSILIAVAISATILSFVSVKENKMDDKGFAVVELFTSEGCSSCPPADAAIARLVAKNLMNVYVLSYHVDYWNRLGWKDEFSDHKYSERQEQYSRRLSLEGVYTPQIIVNGNIQFVGSDENALNNAITKSKASGTPSNLHIKAEMKNSVVLVKYSATDNESQLLNVAVVLPDADTKVKRGENGGKILHHVNIVSAFKVLDIKSDGEVSVKVPVTLTGKKLKVIAFTQSRHSLKVTGADEVDL